MRNILLVEPAVKSIMPNMGLSKLSTYYKSKGDCVKYVYGTKYDLGGFIPDHIDISAIYSFYARTYDSTIDFYHTVFPSATIRIGGVFPSMCPDYFKKYGFVTVHRGPHTESERLQPDFSICPENDNLYIRASTGCRNKCAYCVVPETEGDFHGFASIKADIEHGKRQIKNINTLVLYDNNFLMHPNFYSICDEIRDSGLSVDVCSGMFAGDLSEDKAIAFSKLIWKSQSPSRIPLIRFSFDFSGYRDMVAKAHYLCTKYLRGLRFFVYMLFGWKDSQADIWDRLQMCRDIVKENDKLMIVFPMRYQPLDSLKKNEYAPPKWDLSVLKGFSRLCSRNRGHVAIDRGSLFNDSFGNSYDEFVYRCIHAQKDGSNEKRSNA